MSAHLGAWYNGSIGVSKTFDGSSILSAPASENLRFLSLFIRD